MKIDINNLPKGITVSKNGKYFYWACNITGIKTFADAGRFGVIVEKNGGVEKLAKEFVLPTVKKYLKEGWETAAILDIVKANNGKLPPIGGYKKKAEKDAPKQPKKKRLKAVLKANTGLQTNDGGLDPQTPKEAVIYPWTKDPDYFKGGSSPLNLAETTKDACLYPNRHLSDQCYGCSIYEQCAFTAKFTPADWKKKNVRNEVIVKQLRSYDE